MLKKKIRITQLSALAGQAPNSLWDSTQSMGTTVTAWGTGEQGKETGEQGKGPWGPW